MAHSISTDDTHNVHSLLSSPDRDFLLRNNGIKIPISELEGKIVCLYFYGTSYKSCRDFTPQLKEVYEKLKAKEENFEVVLIPLDGDEESFEKEFETMPWLSLPIKDKNCEKLVKSFELLVLPTLVVIGPDGKTLHPNIAEAIDGDGIDAYDIFPPDNISEYGEITTANEENEQTLESILVYGDQDFVIGKHGAKISVSELSGKTVFLYFTANRCPPCRAYLVEFLYEYQKIMTWYKALPEVVFVSMDRDQASYDEFFDSLNESFAEIRWGPDYSFGESRYKIPFGDSRIEFLRRKFKVSSIPMIVWIGASGQTLTTKTRNLFARYGPHAYPFITEGWSEKLKQKTHDHELVLMRNRFSSACDDCNEDVCDLSYSCEECGFYLHPECTLEGKSRANAKKEEGWPDKVMHKTHDHELVLMPRRRSCVCTDCDEELDIWSYCCKECRFDLHPECALEGKISRADAKKDEGWPETVMRKTHEHELVLMRRKYFFCSECNKYLDIWSYCCEECDCIFALHPKCALEEKERIADTKKDEGWPEKVMHKTHDHELVLMRRLSYVCDDCNEDLDIWSYCCKECDFDLHPECALEGKISRADAKRDKDWPEKGMHKTHDHELVLMRRLSYVCDDCDEDLDIWSYCCKECDFDLHPECALEGKISRADAKKEEGWPEKVMHKTHDHELLLMHRKDCCCSECKEDLDLWSYCCEECDFDLHPKCALGDKGSKDDDAKEEEKSK